MNVKGNELVRVPSSLKPFPLIYKGEIIGTHFTLARSLLSQEKIKMILRLFLLTCLPLCLRANWPQYHGPNLDKSSTAGFLSNPSSLANIKILWKEETPFGFSSLTTGKSSAYTLIAREDEDGLIREVCIALDQTSGKVLWQKWLGIANYGHSGGNAGTSSNSGGDGPRSTPSVFQDRVYIYDSSMVLYCLNAQTGDEIWKVDVIKEHEGENIMWKNASSPLLVNDLVIIYGGGPGRSMLGLDQLTGKPRWKKGSEIATHATPALAHIHGHQQVIFLCRSGLVSLRVKDGEELWRQAFPFKVSSAASPVIAGNHVFCSAGYGVGSGLYEIEKKGDKFYSTEVWRKRNELVNHWSTPLFYEGNLYGIFGFKEYGEAPLQCVELASGEICWSQDGFGPGNLIRIKNMLMVLSDDGKWVVVEATPKRYIEKIRKKVLQGKCWSTPTVGKNILLLRSTKETVALGH